METNKLEVRLATVHDAAQLVALNDAFNGVGVTKEEVEQSLATGNECVAVALVNGVVVGFACAQSFRSFCYREAMGEITEMYVAPSARGQGLAGMLLACLEEQLRMRGVQQVKVLTGEDNVSAHRAYLRAHYTREDEVMLEKWLDDSN